MELIFVHLSLNRCCHLSLARPHYMLHSDCSIMWRYFKSKQALVIILWYMLLNISLESIPYTSMALWSAMLVAIFFLYPFFGMVADIWCGRYLMITIGMCITWGGAILVAAYVANEASFSNIYLVTVLQSAQLVGIGIFQANALQFGTDQLKDMSSEHFSSFVHWYVWAQEIASYVYDWLKVAFDFVTPAYSHLIELLLVAGLISLVLCFRFIPTCRWTFENQMKVNPNPYKLIFGVLKFAWRHKQPVKRSAFTFWEENIPSRIELGKLKYGGPYTNENVEDVKTFFRITSLLLSLTAFFTCRNAFLVTNNAPVSGKFSQLLISRGIVDGLIFISLPLHELVIYPFAKSLYPGMMKRTLLGGIVTLFAECMFLILYAIDFSSNIEETTLGWLTIIRDFCDTFGYLIFTISLFEFIVAQSPQSMRGLLIGVYYCTAYGISQFAAWILYLPFHENGKSLYELIYLTMMTAVGIVGLAIFARASSMYKNRERDEVVNIHQFAESYFAVNSEND